MNQINPTEMLRERHAGLLREAEERRLARRLRSPQGSPRTEGGRLGPGCCGRSPRGE